MPTLTPSVVVRDLASIALTRALVDIPQLPVGLWKPVMQHLNRYLTDALVESAEPSELPNIVTYLLTDILLDRSILPAHQDVLLNAFYDGISRIISGNFEPADEDD